MEKDGADIVEMASEGEKTAPLLPVPDFDLEVVATADKQGL